ncbi:MAG: MoaD/ThiS family protein [Methanomassiliicoccales archaeon]|nr:MoaD/ThiS family protein [Methanomassiliicoccales archaeon]
MNVKVRFLANYRELVGSGEMVLDLKKGATVGSLLEELYQRLPRLAQQRDEAIVSVNRKQAPERQELHEMDEIVLLPPAVGG